MVDEAHRLREEIERAIQGEYPGARVQIGWEGLAPMPGGVFAEIMTSRGSLAKVYGNSTLDAITRLGHELFGEPEPVDREPDAGPG